jgi:putative flippase GtrA
VGAAQNLLNIGMFAVGVACGLPYLLAAIVAGAVALGASFIANRHWTFHGTDRRVGRQAATYTAVFVAASLGALGVLAFLAEVVELPKILAQALSLALMAPLSYLAQRRLTFGG